VGGVVLALLLTACSGGAPGSAGDATAVGAARETTPASAAPPPSPRPKSPPVGSGPSTAAPSSARRDRPRVVFLGDSLTAGYGLAEEQAFPALLGELLAADGHPIEVVNAGVSGDTSAGGLARLGWILRQNPDVVMVELGPNDGLRGQPLAATESNLREIVQRCRAAGARVLLVGMQIPPNYGADYAGGFRALYPRLARELSVPLVPFLLAGVGGEPALNQADGLHPNVEGEKIVARNVLPYLRDVVAGLADR
jgi:acyl-CoA thioesterase I